MLRCSSGVLRSVRQSPFSTLWIVCRKKNNNKNVPPASRRVSTEATCDIWWSACLATNRRPTGASKSGRSTTHDAQIWFRANEAENQRKNCYTRNCISNTHIGWRVDRWMDENHEQMNAISSAAAAAASTVRAQRGTRPGNVDDKI